MRVRLGTFVEPQTRILDKDALPQLRHAGATLAAYNREVLRATAAQLAADPDFRGSDASIIYEQLLAKTAPLVAEQLARIEVIVEQDRQRRTSATDTGGLH
ncbi:MAG: hypothetical protein H0X67_08130 [Acidobacteria bacterium]|nr:hypothetical protein [Acidobacteriota bacterium]